MMLGMPKGYVDVPALVRHRAAEEPHHVYCQCAQSMMYSLSLCYIEPDEFLAPFLFGGDDMPKPRPSPARIEAYKREQQRQAEARTYCERLIPVPREHGPRNRYKVGEALAIAVRMVRNKEQQEADDSDSW